MFECNLFFLNQRIYGIPLHELCKIFFPFIWLSFCLVAIFLYILYPLKNNTNPHWVTTGIISYIAFMGIMFFLHIHYNLRKVGYALLSQIEDRNEYLKKRNYSSLIHSIIAIIGLTFVTLLLLVFTSIDLNLAIEYCTWLSIALSINIIWFILSVYTWVHYTKILNNMQGIEMIQI